jgi:hypothetical protein
VQTLSYVTDSLSTLGVIDRTGKIRIGVMTFDSADADFMIAQGIWNSVVLHEMVNCHAKSQ